MNQLTRPVSPRKPSPPNPYLTSGAVNTKYDEQLVRYQQELAKYERARHLFERDLQTYFARLAQQQYEKDQRRLSRLVRQERDITLKLKRVQKRLSKEINFDPEPFYSAITGRIF